MVQKALSSKPVKKQTLAEQVAETIREAILAGDPEKGAVLPTEAELGEQFGVSRAVIRDATRILMAQGLVVVRHGSGVYVTESPLAAFGDALMLALRRLDARVWDVEQFEQIVLPEVIALAAAEASDSEVAEIRRLAEAYLAYHAECAYRWRDDLDTVPPEERAELALRFRRIFLAIYGASHNRLLELMAEPLVNLRSLRNWRAEDFTPERLVKAERRIVGTLVDMIAGRDPERARAEATRLLALPGEAIAAMQRTPVGETVVIEVVGGFRQMTVE